MNAVEVEAAVSDLAVAEFDKDEFPYSFLRAFGNKETTINLLRNGGKNASDCGGVLQVNNVHIAVTDGNVSQKLTELRESKKTKSKKSKFIVATNGEDLEAENLISGDIVVCRLDELPDHFAFFLPLAGISAERQLSESIFDVRATGRLNRLYVELVKDNPDWASSERRHEMNHFVTRLIFCFFADDTNLFSSPKLFAKKIETMSAADSSNTDFVISEIFRTMNLPLEERDESSVPRWAREFPYVNGGLFAGSCDVPTFSKVARAHLVHIGNLDWTKINPDIFGSMVQAIADDSERSDLGLHYTSVPNILKVLNPLFLDTLREELIEAKYSRTKLVALREKISRIRVFDPACGSGNFLVIAYKQLRALEAEINERLNEVGRKSEIPLTNFRGIEIRDFAAEVARLALIIAEYQCNELFRDQSLAIADFLPLSKENWIISGNALTLDWEQICPPLGVNSSVVSEDLFESNFGQSEISFANDGGEIFICGNPPYLGSTPQTEEHKNDLERAFGGMVPKWKKLDYVTGWMYKAALYCSKFRCIAAFVTTNSIFQGEQVPILWPPLMKLGMKISFAHQSFKWSNLARNNAGVTVAIVGISAIPPNERKLYYLGDGGESVQQVVDNINPYLVAGVDVIVDPIGKPLFTYLEMNYGNKPTDDGNLLLSPNKIEDLGLSEDDRQTLIRPFYGAEEYIQGKRRFCLWIEDQNLDTALRYSEISDRIERIRSFRSSSPDPGARKMAYRSHQMREMNIGKGSTIVVPRVSSMNRDFLPAGILPPRTVVGDSAFAIFDGPLWALALIVSRLHLAWIDAVCGKMKSDFRYSNTLGWNTFPIPTLSQKNYADLTRSAEDILLAREENFPMTIAQMYAAGSMPENLAEAHEANEEIVDRIYIGRRFRNDTERREKLFEMYSSKVKSMKRPSK